MAGRSARPAARRSSPRSPRPCSATSTATCPLVDAIAAPRLSSRNGKAEDAEPALLGSSVGAALQAHGPRRSPRPRGAAGDRRGHRDPHLSRHAFQAAAEPVRRGGGSAMVVHRSRPLDEHPEGARARMTGDRELAGEPPGQFRVQPPLQRVRAEVLLHDQVRRAAVGQARQPGAAACRAAPPCRPGSAGWTRSPRTAGPSGTSSGVQAWKSASPSGGGVVPGQVQRPLVDVDRPDRGAAGESRPRVSAIGPQPQPRSSRAPVAGGAGACSRAGPRCRRRAGRGRRRPGGLHADLGARPA